MSKALLNNLFFVFFLDFDKKSLCFCRKVFGRVVKNALDLSSGTLTDQHFRMEVLKTRGYSDNFWSFRDNGEKKIFRFGKTAIDVRRNSLWNFFSKENNSLFFPILSECLLPAKISPELRNPQSMYPWKFLGKNIFWNIYNLSHFFRTLIQKTLSRKEYFFPGRHNCNPRVQRHFLRKSTFFK